MINWLVQSQQQRFEGANGRLPQSWLCATEMARLATLKKEKRRRDWLLGRWTAKQLLQQVIQDQTQQTVPLNLLEIGNSPQGDPIVNCQLLIVNCQFSLSISHSHDHAFCAVVEGDAWPIGADMELIESRADVFVQDYFTADEQMMIAQTVPAMRDVMVTAVWSAKEAVLKALHLGLTVDTRRVNCVFEGVVERPLTWTPYSIEIDMPTISHPPTLTGWWRTFDTFVLTLAIKK
ncbi:MAG: 4'-phosphopantetheinyl transferase superfamily protein [Chloroflexi bacterium]|nr:4'-phosphopantetheinyl transferase superfamily protein [Chloroflexota bacterium]